MIWPSTNISFRKEFSIDYYEDTDNCEIENVVFKNSRNYNLQVAISKLEGKQRQAVYLVKMEEMKIKDVSKILNISEANVKILVHRGIKKLRKIIGEEDDLYV